MTNLPTYSSGKERDTESGLDYFGARYYASNMGRFMSPDWSVKAEPVPYAKLDNPQSLNLYGYVLNNPLSKADPDGHAWCPACTKFLTALGNTFQVKTSVGSGVQVSGSMLGAKVTAGASTKTVTTYTPFGSKPTDQKSVTETGIQAQIGTAAFTKLTNTTTVGADQDAGTLGVKGGTAATSLSSSPSLSTGSASASTSGSISVVGLTFGVGPVLGGVELSISTSDAMTALRTVGPAISGAVDAATGGIFNGAPSSSSGQNSSIWNLPQQ